jgi:hypothetical protein
MLASLYVEDSGLKYKEVNVKLEGKKIVIEKEN